MKRCLRPYADSEVPDQPAHQRSLNGAAVRKQNHWILQNVSMDSKGPGCIAHAQDVILRVLRMHESTCFVCRGQYHINVLVFSAADGERGASH